MADITFLGFNNGKLAKLNPDDVVLLPALGTGKTISYKIDGDTQIPVFSIDNAGNFTINKNLTVAGTQVTVNSNEVNIGDSILLLNSDETGAPSVDGGIEIERGTSDNVSLVWVEADDRWSVGSESFYAGGGFTGDLTGDVTGTVSSIANHDTDALSEGTTNLYFTDSRAQGAFTAGTGINITGGTIAGQDASTTQKGIASFDASDFSVASGAVSLTDLTVSHLDPAAVITASEGLFSNSGDDKLPTVDAVKGFVDALASSQQAHAVAGAGITKGQFLGFDSNGKLSPLGNSWSGEVIGVASDDFSADDPVNLSLEGRVVGIPDLTGVTKGDRLYLSTDGQSLTKTPPTSGPVVMVGLFMNDTSNDMRMLLKIQHIMDN